MYKIKTTFLIHCGKNIVAIIITMVINPIKTKSVTVATRQKHQLSPLPLDLVLKGAKIDQESEHRLLGITMDNTLRWDLYTNNVCTTVSK